MARAGKTTGADETGNTGFWSDTINNYQSTNLNELYANMKEQMLQKFANYFMKGSSWTINDTVRLY